MYWFNTCETVWKRATAQCDTFQDTPPGQVVQGGTILHLLQRPRGAEELERDVPSARAQESLAPRYRTLNPWGSRPGSTSLSIPCGPPLWSFYRVTPGPDVIRIYGLSLALRAEVGAAAPYRHPTDLVAAPAAGLALPSGHVEGQQPLRGLGGRPSPGYY